MFLWLRKQLRHEWHVWINKHANINFFNTKQNNVQNKVGLKSNLNLLCKADVADTGMQEKHDSFLCQFLDILLKLVLNKADSVIIRKRTRCSQCFRCKNNMRNHQQIEDWCFNSSAYHCHRLYKPKKDNEIFFL